MRDIIQLGHVNFKENPDTFLLHWDITSKCNYRCHYCTYENRDEHFKSYKEKIRILEFIEYITTIKDVVPVLFGGEPTLDPDFLRIIDSFPKLKSYPITVFTNLSRSESFFGKLCGINRPLKIMTSFHYSESDYDQFYNKILFLLSKGMFVRVKIMWDSHHKNIIKDIYYKFKKLEEHYPDIYFCTMDIVYNENQNFLKEDLDWYYSIQDGRYYYIEYDYLNGSKYEITSFNRIKLRAHKLNGGKVNLKFYRCDCGKSCLFITSSGDVLYCQTMRKNKKPPIFNVHNVDYNRYLDIFNKNIICTEDNCHSEISVPKNRILKYVGSF